MGTLEIKYGVIAFEIMGDNKKDLTNGQVIMYALSTEMVLVVFQFIYLKIYVNYINPGADFAFNEAYMKDAGFYIFLIIGFFVMSVLSFFIVKKSQKKLLDKTLLLFITGTVIELLFYNLISATYEGVFLYSILDKFIAIFIGAIAYFVLASPEQNSKSI